MVGWYIQNIERKRLPFKTVTPGKAIFRNEEKIKLLLNKAEGVYHHWIWDSQENNFSFQDTDRLRVKGCKEIFQANGNQKKAGVAILRQNRIKVKKEEKGQNKERQDTIKGWFHEEDITIINNYAPNIGIPKHININSNRTKRTKKTKNKKNPSNSVIVGDFNTQFQQWIGYPNKESIRKLDLNNTIDQNWHNTHI